jgi:hypothetical protein
VDSAFVTKQIDDADTDVVESKMVEVYTSDCDSVVNFESCTFAVADVDVDVVHFGYEWSPYRIHPTMTF